MLSRTGAPADGERVRRMVATLRHRGPDDWGVHAEGPVGLGAARLSIIDVTAGHQPISTPDGAITVVQNGEIYNYVELRDELERAGHKFATACDTEVIAHLYAREGRGAFTRMRGMFAVAIWDARCDELILARDRAGKKPLYYAWTGRALLFGSEMKALLAAMESTPAVHAPALLRYLTFGCVTGEDAIFAGVRRVPPGGVLTVTPRAAEPRVERWWRWPTPARRNGVPPDAEVIEGLREELSEAVRLRLRSDVPLGAFLSGGVDSATVLALMARHSARPVQTFTIGFGDPEYDELDDARRTASYFGADHHEWVVTPDGVRVAETLATYYDEPFADASALPTFHVAELARRHVTVCLSGDGGDELFAGYTPYAQALQRASGPATDALRALLGAGAWWVPVHARGKGRLTTLALGPESWFVWRRTTFPEYLLRRTAGPALLGALPELPERAAVRSVRGGDGALLSRLQQWDQRQYLPDDILVKVDRATMAHSLEARCPFLDHRVIERAAVLPPEWHGGATETKRLLREAVRPWLPAEVLARPKRGFGVPLRRWLGEGLIGWAREILTDRRTEARGFTRPDEVARLLTQHERGTRDHAARIWTLVCLELWARRHADAARPAELPTCA